MSGITSIVTNMGTLIDAVLTTYGRIANPYVPEANDQLALAKGYGIGIGPGSDPKLYQGCRVAYNRTFQVLLYNVMTAMPSDAAGRVAQDLALIEDFRLVRRTLEQNQTISGAAIKCDYVSDGGIELSVGQVGKYISIAIEFAVLYEEAL